LQTEHKNKADKMDSDFIEMIYSHRADATEVSKIVEKNKNIINHQVGGDNIIHYLIWYKPENDIVDLISQLIKLGVSVHALGNIKQTPLHYAAEKNYPLIIDQLVQNNAKINAKDMDGRTPLITAAFKNHIAAVEKLIQLGADCNARDNKSNTPLTMAVKHLNVNMVKLLIKSGATDNAATDDDQQAIVFAMYKMEKSTDAREIVNCLYPITKLNRYSTSHLFVLMESYSRRGIQFK